VWGQSVENNFKFSYLTNDFWSKVADMEMLYNQFRWLFADAPKYFTYATTLFSSFQLSDLLAADHDTLVGELTAAFPTSHA